MGGRVTGIIRDVAQDPGTPMASGPLWTLSAGPGQATCCSGGRPGAAASASTRDLGEQFSEPSPTFRLSASGAEAWESAFVTTFPHGSSRSKRAEGFDVEPSSLYSQRVEMGG